MIFYVKTHLKFWIKTSFTFALLALCFSFLGFFMDVAQEPHNPLSNLSIEHVLGHIAWGMIAAIPALSFRYIMTSGLFAILLDSDHLIQFLGFDMISRMGHSIPFAVLVAFSMLIIFGKKDYLLASISFAAVLSHISFDTFRNNSEFPLFIPFDLNPIILQSSEWGLILFSAITVVASVKLIIFQKTRLKKKLSSESNK